MASLNITWYTLRAYPEDSKNDTQDRVDQYGSDQEPELFKRHLYYIQLKRKE